MFIKLGKRVLNFSVTESTATCLFIAPKSIKVDWAMSEESMLHAECKGWRSISLK